MRLVGRYGSFHPAVKRPSPLHHIRNHVRQSFKRSAHQLATKIELRETPNPQAHKVAVIGGGITGLSTAFQIARTIPHAEITIFEKKGRLGGWLHSEIVEVDDGEVLFEWGPRALRPDLNGPGLATIALVMQLRLLDKIIITTKNAPAATNRFIYWPDHLVRMPGPNPSAGPLSSIFQAIYTILTEPVFKGVVPRLLSEPTVTPRDPQIADESVGHFLRRRFGKQVTDNLASAIIHGIYAGDLYKLSARTIFPTLWYAETRDPEGNGIIAEFADLFFKNHFLRRHSDVYFHNLTVSAQDMPTDVISQASATQMMQSASVYTFARGFSELIERLRETLEMNPKVNIRTGSSVSGLSYNADDKKVAISVNGVEAAETSFDYVVSTTSPSQLQEQLSHQGSSGGMSLVHKPFKAVNVMVVNLYYASPDLIPSTYRGFGYLLPRSLPIEQNPERALGVLFSSESSGMRGRSAVELSDADKELRERMAQAMQGRVRELESIINDPSISEKAREESERRLTVARDAYDSMQPDRVIRSGQDTAPGTKLTVMIGGHWWDEWQETDLPSEEQAIDMAKSVLARHLKIMEAPLVAKARLNRDCIPQYPVGYRQEMAHAHRILLDKFQGRLKVAGPWWQGAVGVNDCVRGARLAAFAIREAWDDHTGLEEYAEDEKFVLGDRRTKEVFMDPMQDA